MRSNAESCASSSRCAADVASRSRSRNPEKLRPTCVETSEAPASMKFPRTQVATGAIAPGNQGNAGGMQKFPPAKTRAACVRPRLFPPHGLLKLVLDLGPRHPAIPELPVGHRGELAPEPGPFPPDMHRVHQRPPRPQEHPGPWRTAMADARDIVQPVQLAALTCACGKGPSAFSVRIESQYSRISLILPSSRRNTRQ